MRNDCCYNEDKVYILQSQLMTNVAYDSLVSLVYPKVCTAKFKT